MGKKISKVPLRHGDVQIQPIAKPENLGKEIERRARGLVLADGEATGHAHVIQEKGANLYEDVMMGNDNGLMLLEVTKPVALRHEEHKSLNLDPGWYRISIKREYNNEHGWQRVVD